MRNVTSSVVSDAEIGIKEKDNYERTRGAKHEKQKGNFYINFRV